MRTLHTCLLALALVAAVLGARAAKGGDRTPVALPSQTPSRIVSLVPAVTEALFAIGAGPRLVGVSSFDDYPPEVERITRVGGLIDPDVERIFSLRPDLVVVYATQADLRQQLGRAGLPIFAYQHAGLADVTDTIRALGRRTGLVDQADRVADGIEAEIEAVRTRTRTLPHPGTLLVFGRQPGTLTGVYASGGVGFLHDMLEISGGVNVFADIKRQSVQASSELILSRNPQVILELQYGQPRTAAERERNRSSWSALSAVAAVRDGRVYVLEGDEFVVPGPRIGAATARLARALHPDAFGEQRPPAAAHQHRP